jgi:hypothetical protein
MPECEVRVDRGPDDPGGAQRGGDRGGLVEHGRDGVVREGTEMTGDIYLVSADGGDTVRLTEDGLGKSAVWAPAE